MYENGPAAAQAPGPLYVVLAGEVPGLRGEGESGLFSEQRPIGCARKRGRVPYGTAKRVINRDNWHDVWAYLADLLKMGRDEQGVHTVW